MCLQKIPFSSAISWSLLIRTVFPTPLKPLKITDWVGIPNFRASSKSRIASISASLPARYVGIKPAPGLYGLILNIPITSAFIIPFSYVQVNGNPLLSIKKYRFYSITFRKGCRPRHSICFQSMEPNLNLPDVTAFFSFYSCSSSFSTYGVIWYT